MPAWSIWLIVAAALGFAESISLAFVLVMFAGGAVVAAIVAASGASDGIQVLTFILASLLLLVVLRPFVVRHRQQAPVAMGAEALVGQRAVALSTVDEYDGRVRLNGAEWSARTLDTATIAVGSVVEVVQITGATALVRAVTAEGPVPGVAVQDSP